MGLHTGNDNFSFFQAQNMRQHVYDGAQPVFNPATDEGRVIYVKNDPTPTNNGFFRGSSAAWLPIGSGGGSGVVVQENGAVIVAAADLLNLINDLGFVSITDAGSGDAQLRVDKHTAFALLASQAAPVVTGFAFVAATYRAVQILYTISLPNAFEAGTITLVHDGTTVAIRVDMIDVGSSAPTNVVFSADISAGNVRLLYTNGTASAPTLRLKPRAMPAA